MDINTVIVGVFNAHNLKSIFLALVPGGFLPCALHSCPNQRLHFLVRLFWASVVVLCCWSVLSVTAKDEGHLDETAQKFDEIIYNILFCTKILFQAAQSR